VSSSYQDSLVDICDIVGEMDIRGGEWHFNTPHASHHGGSWERKIAAVRRVLETSLLNLGGRLLSREEFTTLLLEAMAIVNNTPLWGVSADPGDPAPLTPSMILTLRDMPNQPHLHEFDSKDLMAYGKLRWRKVQYLSECFWRQWREHYLTSLNEKRKWTSKVRNVRVGDVVLLRDKNSKRNNWPTGIISAVKKSEECVRSVSVDVVKTLGKIVRRHTYARPICDIVLLIPHQESD